MYKPERLDDLPDNPAPLKGLVRELLAAILQSATDAPPRSAQETSGQEQRYARLGFPIVRSTFCDGLADAADVLTPLWRALKERVLVADIVHTDDAPVLVQDPDRDDCRTGRIWVYDLVQVFRTARVHYFGQLRGSEPMSRAKPKQGSASRREESFEGVGGRRRRYTEEFAAVAVQILRDTAPQQVLRFHFRFRGTASFVVASSGDELAAAAAGKLQGLGWSHLPRQDQRRQQRSDFRYRQRGQLSPTFFLRPGCRT